MGDLRIYNTLTGSKEVFAPLCPGKVGMYCCGPTTYNFIHVGNGRPLVVFDTARRYLLYKGYEVKYVVNFTDVDDKIINRAREEGRSPQELADQYIQEYFRDADALGAARANVYPRVSEHMADIIAFVAELEGKGLAYAIDGDVYYAVREFKGYGKLSKREREDLLDGARVDVDQRKREPGDFALWKKAKPGEPAWESPWGLGRPGWHIECSAMAYKYLGESFDIHAGGADLIFPHHENEIAQSEGRFGRPMAKYWMHNGFITINQEKMSKSLGNFFLLRDVLKKFPGQVIRFYLLSVHYRSPLDFDDQKLLMAQKGLERLKNAARLAGDALAQVTQVTQAQDTQAGLPTQAQDAQTNQAQDTGDGQAGSAADREGAAAATDSGADAAIWAEIAQGTSQFEAAMDDDCNTALAIAALFDLARGLNSYVGGPERPASGPLRAGLERLLALADVLGLTLIEAANAEDDDLNQALSELLRELGRAVPSAASLENLMDALLILRQDCRRAKDFAAADRIRDGLKALGIGVEDTAQGARWRRG
ncbi:MAG: cysteine--tRNA ligase [Peptococcaceae bacterium]|jgi:cysteinyl-tRNA synthetase|nr:cysteine--tRNA ligase [Peptococcaceae bacterium]